MMSEAEHHNALQYFLEVKGLAQFSEIIHHEFGSLVVLASANRDALVLAGIRNENMLNTFIRSIADLNNCLKFFVPCGTKTWRCRSCGDTCPDYQLDVHLQQGRCFPDMQKLQLDAPQLGAPMMQAQAQAQPHERGQAWAVHGVQGAGAQAVAHGGEITVLDVLRESGVCADDEVESIAEKLASMGADAVQRLPLVTAHELEALGLPQCVTQELFKCFSSIKPVAVAFRKGMNFREWLAMHELSIYEKEFQKMGFRTATTIRMIHQNEATMLGMQKEIHRRQLFILVRLTTEQQ
jgi:hypothetical protein